MTSVEVDGPEGTAIVSVGTAAPEGVSWEDLSAHERRDGETAKARDRILDAA